MAVPIISDPYYGCGTGSADVIFNCMAANLSSLQASWGQPIQNISLGYSSLTQDISLAFSYVDPQFQDSYSYIPGACVSVCNIDYFPAGFAPYPLLPASLDLSVLTSVVDFSSTTDALLLVFALLVGVAVVFKAGRSFVQMIASRK